MKARKKADRAGHHLVTVFDQVISALNIFYDLTTGVTGHKCTSPRALAAVSPGSAYLARTIRHRGVEDRTTDIMYRLCIY